MKVSYKKQGGALLGGLFAVAAVMGFDYWNSWEFSLSLFYVLIVGIVSYQGGLTVGTIVAFASVAAWTTCELLTGIPYTHWLAPFWSVGIRSAMFLLFAYLSSRLPYQKTLEILSRTDGLTGVWNRRYFYELAAVELERASRYQHPFTMVFIDLDGFKEINDTLGHQAGDEVLQNVARSLRANIRATDFVARFGGDEFAVFLSETNENAAIKYLDKMRRQLLKAMKESGWNVTFSIGAITYDRAPNSIDGMIGRADHLMYSVKRNGKNQIKHEVFSDGQ